MRLFGMAYGYIPVEFENGKWVNVLGHSYADSDVVEQRYANSLVEYLKS